ncbi:PstA family ABC transporter permease [Aeromicrobium sp. UC242_57]|uniref:PstA family ABC transporter permease n=1 Tax=Aeromicrobium sp. UC242_57 TaxID=3374624 RepID=UPI0037BB773E
MLGVAVLVGAALYFTGTNLVLASLAVWVVSLALPLWSAVVEGRRKATDRLVTVLVTSAFVLAMFPLVSILYTVISKGTKVLSAEFFTYSMRNVVGEGGGIYHALIGTLLITGAAAVISIPIGLFAAIYLVEYADGNRLSRWIRFLVDVMTGIPSIVAGLFAYALFVLFFGEGVRMGIGGSVALSVLMIPVLVRSTEEMLKPSRTSCARRRTRSACRSGAPSPRSCCPPRWPASSPVSRWPSPVSSARPHRC